MSDQETPNESAELQFDRVVSASPGRDGPEPQGVRCENCHSAIDTKYFQINGHVCCERCKTAIEAAAEPPTGFWPFAMAASVGFAAALVGAAIYWAVLALAHLQIGLVAILIGYMVGTAVRRGAGMRGSLRFQILAVVLTYGAVALAYTPVVVSAALKAQQTKSARTATDPGTQQTALTSANRPRQPGPILALLTMFGFIAALPVLVVVGSLPGGLLSGLIIGFGLQQAWRITAQTRIEVFGPYRVGNLAVQA
jgi:hypothetical protein